jgi:hypothetical protein
MLAHEVGSQIAEGLRAFSEPAAPSWLESPGHPSGVERDAMTLAALADTPLASRFCLWPGFSGRKYIFSVYSWSECPAFCHALLLAAVRDDTGRRRALSVSDTGAFPEPVLLRAQRDLGVYGARLEFHMHLLASSAAERDSVLTDLVGQPAAAPISCSF